MKKKRNFEWEERNDIRDGLNDKLNGFGGFQLELNINYFGIIDESWVERSWFKFKKLIIMTWKKTLIVTIIW